MPITSAEQNEDQDQVTNQEPPATPPVPKDTPVDPSVTQVIPGDPEPPQEPEPEPEVTLTLSEIEALIEQKVQAAQNRAPGEPGGDSLALLANTLKQMQGNLNQMSQANSKFMPTGNFEPDPDDYLPDAVIMWAPCMGKTIFDDKRLGQVAYPPYNEQRANGEWGPRAIRFYGRYQKKMPGAGSKKDYDVLTVSTAMIRSKKELQWLREHSKFGIEFFEDIRQLRSVNVAFLEALQQASAMLSNKALPQLLAIAGTLGIKAQQDPQEMRKLIAWEQAQRKSKTHMPRGVNAFNPNEQGPGSQKGIAKIMQAQPGKDGNFGYETKAEHFVHQ